MGSHQMFTHRISRILPYHKVRYGIGKAVADHPGRIAKCTVLYIVLYRARRRERLVICYSTYSCTELARPSLVLLYCTAKYCKYSVPR